MLARGNSPNVAPKLGYVWGQMLLRLLLLYSAAGEIEWCVSNLLMAAWLGNWHAAIAWLWQQLTSQEITMAMSHSYMLLAFRFCLQVQLFLHGFSDKRSWRERTIFLGTMQHEMVGRNVLLSEALQE